MQLSNRESAQLPPAAVRYEVEAHGTANAVLANPLLHKGCGRNPEAFAQCTHLPNVELTLARQDFRNDALAADLGEVTLLQAVKSIRACTPLVSGSGWCSVS